MRAMAARWYARRSGAGRRPVQKLVDVLHRLGISIGTGELPQRILLERRQRLRAEMVTHVPANQIDLDLEPLHASDPTSPICRKLVRDLPPGGARSHARQASGTHGW